MNKQLTVIFVDINNNDKIDDQNMLFNNTFINNQHSTRKTKILKKTYFNHFEIQKFDKNLLF